MIMIMVILMIKMKVSFNFRLRKNESLSHSYEWDEDLRQVHFKLDRMAEQVGHGRGSYIQVTPVLAVSDQWSSAWWWLPLLFLQMGWAILLMTLPRGLEQPVQLNFEVTKIGKVQIFPKDNRDWFCIPGHLGELVPCVTLGKENLWEYPIYWTLTQNLDFFAGRKWLALTVRAERR